MTTPPSLRRTVRAGGALLVGLGLAGLPALAWAGAPGAPAASPESKEASGPAVTFTGFRILQGGGSQIEVVLTSEPRVEETVQGKTVTYLLVGTRVPVRNNENPLITRDFDTVVTSARLVTLRDKKKRKKTRKSAAEAPPGARLVIELREAVRPQHHMVRNPDGTATLFVNFPKPSSPHPSDPSDDP